LHDFFGLSFRKFSAFLVILVKFPRKYLQKGKKSPPLLTAVMDFSIFL